MAERIPPITELCSSIIGSALHNSSELEQPFPIDFAAQYDSSQQQQPSASLEEFLHYDTHGYAGRDLAFQLEPSETVQTHCSTGQPLYVFGREEIHQGGMGLQLPLLHTIPYDPAHYPEAEDQGTLSCDDSMQLGGDASSVMENEDPLFDPSMENISVQEWESNSHRPSRRSTRETGGRRKNRRRTPTHAQRKAANIRERKRMCNLNKAFDMLRKIIPTFAYEKHLSRIDTLRLAMDYIKFMEEIMVKPEEDLVKYANAAHEMAVKWNARV